MVKEKEYGKKIKEVLSSSVICFLCVFADNFFVYDPILMIFFLFNRFSLEIDPIILLQIMAPRKKLTREERLEKKRQAEQLRYQRIKNDPEKYELQKQKDKEKYLKKKEKGLIKTVDQMTSTMSC